MKQTLTYTSKTEAQIKFIANKEDWAAALQKSYELNKGKYQVQGFRKGHAPKKVIEQNYGANVFVDDAIAEVANNAYRKVFEDNKDFDPIGEPRLAIDKLDDNGLEGSITISVVPAPVLGEYKGLTVEANVVEFNDSMVDEQLAHAQKHHTQLKTVEGKVSANGDTVVLDFVGSCDGVEFEGGKAYDYALELGSKAFIDTFEDQLVGKKAGDQVTVKVTFPKDYGAPTLAGKKAVFECDIKAVQVPEVPALDDEFAKTASDFDTLAEYRKDIEDQVKHRISHENENIIEDAIIDAILAKSEVIVPEIMLNNQLDRIMQDLNYRLAYQGIQLSDYANYMGTTVEKLREDRRADAERISKIKLMLEAIIRKEKMKATEKEMESKIAEIAKMQGKSTEEVKKSLDSHRLEHVESDILMDKLLKFLKKNNTVVEKAKAPAKKAAAKKTTTEKATKTAAKTTTKKVASKKAETAEEPAEKPAKKATTKSATKTAATKSAETKTTTKKAATKTTAKTEKVAEEKPKRTCARKTVKKEEK